MNNLKEITIIIIWNGGGGKYKNTDMCMISRYIIIYNVVPEYLFMIGDKPSEHNQPNVIEPTKHNLPTLTNQ